MKRVKVDLRGDLNNKSIAVSFNKTLEELGISADMAKGVTVNDVLAQTILDKDANNWTEAQYAAILQERITAATVSQIEKGEVALIVSSVLDYINETLGLSIKTTDVVSNTNKETDTLEISPAAHWG